MSQSPIEDFSERSLVRYRQGWQALNRLLHEDRSFSGQEKNCVFLNTGGAGGERFADISAVSGLDFADDGRAVAVGDWDFDGDVDIWVTNRTAPRIRLMRNDGGRDHHFLAIQLRGDGQQTNRDAIGARVEIVLADDNPRPLIKTLHAGDGFLSQSSRWLHFGLGDADRIQHVVVHWPGGERSQYDGMQVDRRYVIDQQNGTVRVWDPPPNRKTLVASTATQPPSEHSLRIVLPSRVLLPTLRIDGRDEPLNATIRRPTLISIWSTTCAACIQELQQFSAHQQRIRDAGVDVIAINLDNLEGTTDSAQQLLAEIHFPFAAEFGTTELVRSLDVLQRAVLDRWGTLNVPFSLLVDRHGQVGVLYQGEARVDQVLADVDLLSLPLQRLRAASTPFSGRWIMPPTAADPLRLTKQFIDEAMVDQGVEYLQRYAAARRHAESGFEGPDAGDVFYVLAILLREQDQIDESRRAFERAAQYHPDDFRVRSDFASLLAMRGQLEDAAEQLLEAARINPEDVSVQRKLAFLRMQQGDPAVAIRRFTQVVKAQPHDVASWYNLANAYRAVGQLENAMKLYRHTLKLEPNMTLAANNLAWILATHPKSELRDGSKAVMLAQRACEQTGYTRPGFLDTLACAHAEAGDFQQAVAMAMKAVELWREQGNAAETQATEARLKSFQNHQPFRDSL